METIIIEIKSALTAELILKDFPRLKSKKKFVQKGLNIVEKKTPKIYRYLSKENALINIGKYNITVEYPVNHSQDEIKKTLNRWIKLTKLKRLFFIIIELLIMPFTAILTPIPGPNFIFYVIFLLFYFHLSGFLSLRKIDIDNLNIKFNEKEIR